MLIIVFFFLNRIEKWLEIKCFSKIFNNTNLSQGAGLGPRCRGYFLVPISAKLVIGS